MYVTIIRRDGNNSLSGRAEYRVAICAQGKLPNKRKVMPLGTVVAIQTPVYYKPNSFICPRKASGFK